MTEEDEKLHAKEKLKLTLDRELVDAVRSFVEKYQTTVRSQNVFSERAFRFYMKVFEECHGVMDTDGFPFLPAMSKEVPGVGHAGKPAVTLVPESKPRRKGGHSPK